MTFYGQIPDDGQYSSRSDRSVGSWKGGSVYLSMVFTTCTSYESMCLHYTKLKAHTECNSYFMLLIEDRVVKNPAISIQNKSNYE